jgi:hypothetical protein
MSDFVEQCRQEWKRLGVPDPLADEMAADLASDLGDAQAEGVSPEEFIGSDDPRSFAASWATERGIIPAPSGEENARHRPFILVAFTALAALTVIVAALLLATGEPKLSLVTHGVQPARLPSQPSVPSGQVVTASAAAPIEWILLFGAVVALGFAAWMWARWNRTQPPLAPAS